MRRFLLDLALDPVPWLAAVAAFLYLVSLPPEIPTR
jgi:hypothetical protein